MLPNASGRFRTHPDVSERIRIGLKTSKNLNIVNTLNNLANTSKNFAQIFTKLFSRRSMGGPNEVEIDVGVDVDFL